MVDQHEASGAEVCDLAAELRADRAAGAGDEHGLSGDVRGHGFEVDLDRLTAEHVLDLNGTDLRGEVEVTRDQLVDARQRLDRHAGLRRDVDDPLAHLSGRGRDGDQDLVRLRLSQEAREILGRPEHAHAVQTEILLARVVVDQADRGVAERRRLQHLADDQLRGVSGADDEYLLPASDDPAWRRPLHDRANEEAGAGNQHQREQEVGRRDRARQPDVVDRVDQVDGQVGHEAGDHDAADDPPHVARRHVAPPVVVEAEEDEDDELDPDDDQDRPLEQRLVEDRDASVEAQLEREVPGCGDERRVGKELPDAMP